MNSCIKFLTFENYYTIINLFDTLLAKTKFSFFLLNLRFYNLPHESFNLLTLLGHLYIVLVSRDAINLYILFSSNLVTVDSSFFILQNPGPNLSFYWFFKLYL